MQEPPPRPPTPTPMPRRFLKQIPEKRQRLEYPKGQDGEAPEGGAPAHPLSPSLLLGHRYCLTPYPLPQLPPGHLGPFLPMGSCISAFPPGLWLAQRLARALGGRAPRSHSGPLGGVMGHCGELAADRLARVPPTASVRGWHGAPSGAGEGGHPGAGGLRLGRSVLDCGRGQKPVLDGALQSLNSGGSRGALSRSPAVTKGGQQQVLR